MQPLKKEVLMSSAQHPAISFVIKFLNSLKDKNYPDFSNCFSKSGEFVDMLPGGVRIESSKDLISGHVGFFDSEKSSFDFGELTDLFGNDSIFHAGTIAKVVRPTGGDSIRVYIGLTFVVEEDRWVPRFLQNTFFDESHAVIESK